LAVIRDPTKVFTDFAIVPADYIIFKYAGVCIAKCGYPGKAGLLEFQSRNPREVFEKVRDALLHRAARIVLLEGEYGVDRVVAFPSYHEIVGLGEVAVVGDIPTTLNPLGPCRDVIYKVEGRWLYSPTNPQPGSRIPIMKFHTNWETLETTSTTYVRLGNVACIPLVPVPPGYIPILTLHLYFGAAVAGTTVYACLYDGTKGVVLREYSTTRTHMDVVDELGPDEFYRVTHTRYARLHFRLKTTDAAVAARLWNTGIPNIVLFAERV